MLKDYNRHRLWINPLDADPRGIHDGDKVRVKSPAGEVEIEAHVTSRIVPSVVAMPQGFWHDADMKGNKLDKGGCINTLTTYVLHPWLMAMALPIPSSLKLLRLREVHHGSVWFLL